MPLEVGSSAPDFNLEDIRGNTFVLQAGSPSLIAFINTQAKANLETNDPSRAQIVFLKSMFEQYSANGLNVLIVDASSFETGSQPHPDDLLNFTYDWQLDSIPVLVDPKNMLAKEYGITSTPTSFLISADGIIQQRWDGFASASQLALSIEPLVGAPAFRNANSTQSASVTSSCLNEALAQAKFAGVGLARPFSNQLWVVDGGAVWGTSTAFPLQFIFIDTQNIAQQQTLHLQVFIQNTATSQENILLAQSMELLPDDIASGLLSGISNPPAIYSLVTSVQIEHSGCLNVRAVIYHESNPNPIYQGSLTVPAR